MRHKQIMRATSADTSTLLATFTLDRGKVRAVYADPGFQAEVEQGVVWTERTGSLTPKDGRVFFDALDKAFANSSFVYVVTSP